LIRLEGPADSLPDCSAHASLNEIRFLTMNRKWHLSHLRGYLELGMDREARRELRKLPTAVREEPEFLAMALQIHQNAQRWPTVERIARRLVKREPGEAGWWVSLAFATRRTRSIEAAREILLKAESLHRKEPTVQFNLACYAAQRGDIGEARIRLARAIARDSQFAELGKTDPDLEPMRRSKE
jgi:predicted Zn-dependent protease